MVRKFSAALTNDPAPDAEFAAFGGGSYHHGSQQTRRDIRGSASTTTHRAGGGMSLAAGLKQLAQLQASATAVGGTAALPTAVAT